MEKIYTTYNVFQNSKAGPPPQPAEPELNPFTGGMQWKSVLVSSVRPSNDPANGWAAVWLRIPQVPAR